MSGEMVQHHCTCLASLRNGNFRRFFQNKFPFDEISINFIKENRHISTNSSVSVLTRTLLSINSKYIKRKNFYKLLQTYLCIRLQKSIEHQTSFMQLFLKASSGTLHSGPFSRLKLVKPNLHIRKRSYKAHKI